MSKYAAVLVELFRTVQKSTMSTKSAGASFVSLAFLCSYRLDKLKSEEMFPLCVLLRFPVELFTSLFYLIDKLATSLDVSTFTQTVFTEQMLLQ